PPPRPTLFPYTTLFRSRGEWLSPSPSSPALMQPFTAGRRQHTGCRRTMECLLNGWRPAPLSLGDSYESALHLAVCRPLSLPARRSEEHTSEFQSRENLV